MDGARERRPDIAVIVAGLADRIEDLCGIILGNGYRDGRVWRVGNIQNDPPRQGGGGGSLVVWLTGSGRGLWKDYACMDKARDALELVTQGMCGGDKRQAIRWSCDWLGYDTSSAEAMRQLAARHKQDEARRKREQAKADKEDLARRKQALALFSGAVPKLAGTPAAAYLKGRGLDLARLGRQPGALRFHPEVYNAEVGRPLPAMLAAVGGVRGHFVAVHRTWLRQDKAGKWTKADLEKPKMCLGRYKGGCIRLWRGEDTDPDTGEVKPAGKLNDAPAGTAICASEGIEDGLTAAMAAPDRRIVAAISLSNLGGLWLPEGVAALTWLGQNDEHPETIEQREQQLDNLARRKIETLVSYPPAGHKDWNDWWQAILEDKA